MNPLLNHHETYHACSRNTASPSVVRLPKVVFILLLRLPKVSAMTKIS